jgi:hypothetical protein
MIINIFQLEAAKEIIKIYNALFFNCLGCQKNQIMIAKFQNLMLLIANAERTPLF